MRRVFIFAALITLIATAGASASVDLWLTQFGETTPIVDGSTIYMGAGNPVNMSLWLSTTDAAGIVSVLLGYAESATWGDSAVPLTTPLLTPVNDESTWISDSSKWPTSNFAARLTTMFPSLGGGYHPTNGAVRPWGLFQSGFFPTDDPMPDTRLFDFYFLSSMAPGDSVTLTIWDASTVGDIGYQDIWTTGLTNMDLEMYRPGYNYTVTLAVPVPEPGSLLMLLTGVGGIAGFAFRRRK